MTIGITQHTTATCLGARFKQGMRHRFNVTARSQSCEVIVEGERAGVSWIGTTVCAFIAWTQITLVVIDRQCFDIDRLELALPGSTQALR